MTNSLAGPTPSLPLTVRPRLAAVNAAAEGAGRFLQAHFLCCLAGCCLLAALLPGPGRAVRDAAVLAPAPGGPVAVTLPGLMLAFLVFNAGLGVRAGELRSLAAAPRPLVAGLVAKPALPLAFVVAVAPLLAAWPDPTQGAALFLGLCLIAAMPVAATSTVWSTGSDGDAALSLGLVVASTLLSPLTTPAFFLAAGAAAGGEGAAALGRLAGQGAGPFLLASVLVPSLAGLWLRGRVGESAYAAARPGLKLANAVNYLVLTYANAAACLPQVSAGSAGGFVALACAAAAGLCLASYGAGWLAAALLRAGRGQRGALVFGLGMTNNSVGQVMAGASLAAHPLVIVPLLCHTILQHVAAGVAAALMARGRVRAAG